MTVIKHLTHRLLCTQHPTQHTQHSRSTHATPTQHPRNIHAVPTVHSNNNRTRSTIYHQYPLMICSHNSTCAYVHIIYSSTQQLNISTGIKRLLPKLSSIFIGRHKTRSHPSCLFDYKAVLSKVSIVYLSILY